MQQRSVSRGRKGGGAATPGGRCAARLPSRHGPARRSGAAGARPRHAGPQAGGEPGLLHTWRCTGTVAGSDQSDAPQQVSSAAASQARLAADQDVGRAVKVQPQAAGAGVPRKEHRVAQGALLRGCGVGQGERVVDLRGAGRVGGRRRGPGVWQRGGEGRRAQLLAGRPAASISFLSNCPKACAVHPSINPACRVALWQQGRLLGAIVALGV